jgi:IclR family transcriptional regulator, pca regulon regulatory protein
VSQSSLQGHIFERSTDPRFSLSVERGLAVLECFTPERPLLGVLEISNELGLSSSTTHRYIATLTRLGYLHRDAQRKYQLALAVTDLGMSTLGSINLAERARIPLEELRMRCPYTITVAVLDGVEVIYVESMRASGRQSRYGLDLDAGTHLPVYCTAAGKLLVAYLPHKVQNALIDELVFSHKAPEVIKSKRMLRTQVRSIAQTGKAHSNQELGRDIYEIAVPIRNESNEVVAALSMAAHHSSVSLDSFIRQMMPHLGATASLISARLGYRR